MRRVINLTVGEADVCAEEIVALEVRNERAVLVMSGGARIDTMVSRREAISVLMDFGYAAPHYRDVLEDLS